MTWIVSGMKWIMLVSGALTCTMAYAAIARRAAIQATFGESLEGAAAEIVVRSWGALIALVGGMLIYGAFNVASRPLVLTIAGLSKVWFIGLLLVFGRTFLAAQAGIALVSDVLQVAAFAVYLVAARRAAIEQPVVFAER